MGEYLKEIQEGLEGVVALETEISYIDGEKGYLEYRGIKLKELAVRSYDFVAYLLIHGEVPTDQDLNDFSKLIKDNRDIDEEILNLLRVCNYNIEAMDALRTVVSYLSHCDPDLNDNSREANMRKAPRLIAVFPTIVAAFYRISQLENLVHPDPNLAHGANFLYMLRGKRPTELEARVIETDFIISAEHELNASTFSARVTASTLADIYSAIISGLGTLKGPIHGGARLAVMTMLDEIPSPNDAENYVLDLFANKKRVMGFGHRVYKTYDPRARIFKKLAKEIAEEKGDSKWYDIAQNIESTVHRELVEKRGRKIFPNVDYYAGVIYKYLDIPSNLATAIFAMGRVAGWIAHYIEQYEHNRLIRPRAKYIGKHDVSIE